MKICKNCHARCYTYISSPSNLLGFCCADCNLEWDKKQKLIEEVRTTAYLTTRQEPKDRHTIDLLVYELNENFSGKKLSENVYQEIKQHISRCVDYHYEIGDISRDFVDKLNDFILSTLEIK